MKESLHDHVEEKKKVGTMLKDSLPKVVLCKLDIYMKRMNLDFNLHHTPKWVKDLNVRAKPKVLRKKLGKNFMTLYLAMIS